MINNEAEKTHSWDCLHDIVSGGRSPSVLHYLRRLSAQYGGAVVYAIKLEQEVENTA